MGNEYDFLDTVQSYAAEDANPTLLLSGDGIGAHSVQRRGQRNKAKYERALAEAATFMNQVYSGRRRSTELTEALSGERIVLSETLSTSDFQLMFSDILDRQLIAQYRDVPLTWSQYIKRNTVADFRLVKRYFVDGANTVLPPVKQLGEYPETAMSEGVYTYSVTKYGRRLPMAWEVTINDDLGALRDVPMRFGQAAAATEELVATQIYADVNGPKTSIYASGTRTIVPGNPPLSLLALQSAFTEMTRQRDINGRPIIIENLILVVPPALTFVAQNIIADGMITLGPDSGALRQAIPNWLRNRVKIVTNWYLPFVTTTGTVGDTAWYLFSDPATGRPGIEMGFLQGHEEPEIFMKTANSQRIGGGLLGPAEGDFDTDSIQYKVRHILGGAPLDVKMLMASTGQGSPITTYPS